jgi:Fungal specific transcription factor domain
MSANPPEVEARVQDLQGPTDKGKLNQAVDMQVLTLKKCDEVKPRCGNCTKHDVLCDFEISLWETTGTALPPVKILPLQAGTTQTDAPPKNHSPSSWSPSVESRNESGTCMESRATSGPPSPKTFTYPLVMSRMDTPSDRLLEMRLLHHYITMTTPTLQARQMGEPFISVSGGNIFANWMIRLALETPSVMDALLGFSAFHLRHINEDDKAASYASLKFMTRAIAQHAHNISSGITPENAEICFATSTLIAFHSSTTCFLNRDEEVNATRVLPLHWFKHWQGIRAVLAAGWDHIQTEDIKAILLTESLLTQNLLLSPNIPSPHSFSFLVADLDRETTDQETQFAYDSAVAWLSKAESRLMLRSLFKFTAVVTSRFIQLLEQEDPRALCICGYFFVLMQKLNAVWWLDGVAAPEFWSVMSFIPDEWKPLMAWGVSQMDENSHRSSSQNLLN